MKYEDEDIIFCVLATGLMFAVGIAFVVSGLTGFGTAENYRREKGPGYPNPIFYSEMVTDAKFGVFFGSVILVMAVISVMVGYGEFRHGSADQAVDTVDRSIGVKLMVRI